ncbi:hypothetical protein MKX67_21780 [Cytobacillus sp. FSL W7-1323]|uniref:N-acetyltransferase domain-containing protein n=1 Tax=Cytobacillus kochii TaxID=859143 RepID=A0A248TIL0_9BACI|nr:MULTISPECIES: hypothetical protein [Cytobacillus]ASV68005.1 hypothetical protein CKF48_12200 [Cytobacillus kochii]MDQ0187294.1 N-acetylglutamate synthase-like GNAT family acetyltransferase [Cytobacillus kochii]MEA1853723.1 hypothetical protein [Cytobacillus sp. OWB-43]MED1605800.1 hypothetical protein [Cytobacillus kochii]
MKTSIVRVAQKQDENELMKFLTEASVRSEGVADLIDYFLIMEDEEGEIKATIGIEPYDTVGLLRSLVMKSETTVQTDLLYLLQQIFLLAKEKGLSTVYLGSNRKSTLQLFLLMGFQQVDKSELPTFLVEKEHIKNVQSVDNSFFLKYSLE